ncbi:XRE family transcriptional regulator [Loktanella sp. D2R18]|uniref:helix-turn-helix domain-containing protein n=1 Tax=Rhodobacterales TaxID=204455 RepID=UPI000DE8A2E5|nr:MULTISPECIES: XRE family transcriptional regulator [Rhodobacterales]MDO6590301.1 helix-turn-helix domain-containing protein [Yoonia sp. 1_MG-2023]RBW42894.1 XRE family transcriptional regulator [Loktanella sp. D2R18]
MPTQRLTGARIREKRLEQGLRQAAVAEAVGISPSYLNLIEHNRRRIGGKLLTDIARLLGVDASLLTDGADRNLLDQMRSAAATFETEAEIARTDEFAARFPGWSALIVAQARRIAALDEHMAALTDRIAHDPQLANSLHEVISAVTSIRSSASILVTQDELDADWQRRFHENIHKDSLRLATSSEALVAYLEAPETEVDVAQSPFEQVESALARMGFHVSALEAGTADTLEVARNMGLIGPAGQIFVDYAAQYMADARALPLTVFVDAYHALDYDPAQLARKFNVDFAAVLRRLASLPADAGHPAMGLAIADVSGALTFLKPVPGFNYSRRNGACPLWPIFGALSRPNQPVRAEVSLPDAAQTRFMCYAIATPQGAQQFDVTPVLQSTMLVVSDPPESKSDPIAVGGSCRICPRPDCTSRREPAIIGINTAAGL